MQKWTKVILASSAILFSFNLTAHANYSLHEQRLALNNCCIRPVFTFSGGLAYTSGHGKNKVFPMIDSSTYSYVANRQSQLNGVFGAFVGEEFKINPLWAAQLGLAYYQTTFSSSGQVTQGADPGSSNTYKYNYDILTQQTLIEGKLLLNWYTVFHPYVSVAFGVAFNDSKGYFVNNPKFLTFSPQFSNNTKKAWTYNLGIGVDMDVPCNWRFGLGYRFTALGKSKLGSGRIDTVPIPGTLPQSHLYVSEFLAQLSYLF